MMSVEEEGQGRAGEKGEKDKKFLGRGKEKGLGQGGRREVILCWKYLYI